VPSQYRQQLINQAACLGFEVSLLVLGHLTKIVGIVVVVFTSAQIAEYRALIACPELRAATPWLTGELTSSKPDSDVIGSIPTSCSPAIRRALASWVPLIRFVHRYRRHLKRAIPPTASWRPYIVDRYDLLKGATDNSASLTQPLLGDLLYNKK
jgi:hypothetical protein